MESEQSQIETNSEASFALQSSPSKSLAETASRVGNSVLEDVTSEHGEDENDLFHKFDMTGNVHEGTVRFRPKAEGRGNFLSNVSQ